MATLSEKVKDELRSLAKSSSLRDDMRRVVLNRHNPIVVNGEVDMDRLLEFLDQYNAFVNHEPKPFKPMIDRVMKL